MLYRLLSSVQSTAVLLLARITLIAVNFPLGIVWKTLGAFSFCKTFRGKVGYARHLWLSGV